MVGIAFCGKGVSGAFGMDAGTCRRRPLFVHFSSTHVFALRVRQCETPHSAVCSGTLRYPLPFSGAVVRWDDGLRAGSFFFEFHSLFSLPEQATAINLPDPLSAFFVLNPSLSLPHRTVGGQHQIGEPSAPPSLCLLCRSVLARTGGTISCS